MADLEYAPILYEEGDAYPPMAYNRVSQLSAVHHATALREHDEEGEHKPPFVAAAGGHVNWNGTSYSLGPVKNVTSVTRTASGEVQIALAIQMKTPHWGVIAWMESAVELGTSTPPVPAELEGTKSVASVKLRLPKDGAFSFLVLDQR